MKHFKQLVLAFLVLLSGTSYAQISVNLFEEFLYGATDDANILLKHYMAPGMKGLGYGVNSGWYNTAKPHETFGFDITLSYVSAIVPEEDKTFEFLQSDGYQYTTLLSGSSTLPTIMGVSHVTPSRLEASIDQQLPSVPYNAPDGVSEDLNRYSLIENSVPTPIIQVGFGIIKGTELKIRWLPNIDYGGFKSTYFGLGGLHSISQWLPVFKDIPVDISAFVGWTKISAEYVIPENQPIVDGTDQVARVDINTFTYQLLASAHVSVITGYVGLGFDNFNTNLKMLGTYEIATGVTLPTDPIDISASGSGGFRTSFGARLKVSIITLSADYTLREYDTLTLALGFSVR